MDTRTHITAFHLQLKSLQVTILVIQIFLMAIGGCVFGLGVAIRPILRLVKPDYFVIVRGICNGMVSIGIIQIFSAGLSCLTSCRKRVWALYLAGGINLLAIILEMAGIASSMFTLTQVSEFANELIYRAWYKWECKPHGSCEAALADYVHRYMLPQTVLVGISVVLQCLSILYISRNIRCLVEKRQWIIKSREDLLDISHHSFDSVDLLAKGKLANTNPVAGSSRASARTSSLSKSPRRPSFHDSAPSFKPNSPPTDANLAKYTTPNSILKGDHGYVHASNSSLNFEDNYARQSQPSSLKGTPSISFNASVEVHYYDKNKATPAYPPRNSPPVSTCVPDTSDSNNNNNNNNGGHSCVPAQAHASGLVCTEAASAAGLCQNVSLKRGDRSASVSGSSDSGHSIYEDASGVAAHLTRILSGQIRPRSRKYSFIGCTPPAPPATPCTPSERKCSKSSHGSPEGQI